MDWEEGGGQLNLGVFELELFVRRMGQTTGKQQKRQTADESEI